LNLRQKEKERKGRLEKIGIVESFIVCTLLFAKYNLDDQIKGKNEKACDIICIGEMITKFWLHNLKGRGYLKDKSEDWMIILQCLLSLGIWDGLIWLRIETNS